MTFLLPKLSLDVAFCLMDAEGFSTIRLAVDSVGNGGVDDSLGCDCDWCWCSGMGGGGVDDLSLNSFTIFFTRILFVFADVFTRISAFSWDFSSSSFGFLLRMIFFSVTTIGWRRAASLSSLSWIFNEKPVLV
jgi:hypothetical protein